MEDASQLLKIPKSARPDIWIRLPKQIAQILVQYGRPSRSSQRNLYGHPLAGLSWERQFEKVLLEHGWEKVSILGLFICQPSKRTISNWQAKQKTQNRLEKF